LGRKKDPTGDFFSVQGLGFFCGEGGDREKRSEPLEGKGRQVQKGKNNHIQ